MQPTQHPPHPILLLLPALPSPSKKNRASPYRFGISILVLHPLLQQTRSLPMPPSCHHPAPRAAHRALRSRVFDERLIDFHYQLPTTSYPLPVIHYQLPTTSYPLPVTHYQLATTSYPLPVIHYQLSTTSYPRSVIH